MIKMTKNKDLKKVYLLSFSKSIFSKLGIPALEEKYVYIENPVYVSEAIHICMLKQAKHFTPYWLTCILTKQ